MDINKMHKEIGFMIRNILIVTTAIIVMVVSGCVYKTSGVSE